MKVRMAASQPGKLQQARIHATEWQHGEARPWNDVVAEEWPIALVYNGVSHVVMMASPADLAALALGFSLTEGIIRHPSELYDWRVIEAPNGTRVEMRISAQRFAELKQQRRNLTGRTGCGLCGAESLDQAIRPVVSRPGTSLPDAHAVQAAIAELTSQQPLQNTTGACHGAAWCSMAGTVVAVREDVGRHNALDKLIGHRVRQNQKQFEHVFERGFALVSSRASFEMVQKSAAAGIGCLVAVSAPTALAIAHAKAANISLIGFARSGRHVIYHQAEV